jgi:prepilin-type N-terminal cleavage/methylation domain-containing protein
MLSYLTKMKNKSGFTLIEALVVVAIVAILAAVGVPSFISSQRRAEAKRHGEHARAFYFAVQQSLLSTLEKDNTEQEFNLDLGGAKINRVTCNVNTCSNVPYAVVPCTHTIVTHPGTGNFFFFFKENGNGEFDADLSFSSDGLSPVAQCSTSTILEPTINNDKVLWKLMNEIKGYLATSGEEGYYYAMFDRDFRVVMAYYSKFVDRTAANGVKYAFTEDNRISGRMFGSFPVQYSFFSGFAVGGISYSRDPAAWFGGIGGGAADSVGIIPGI